MYNENVIVNEDDINDWLSFVQKKIKSENLSIVHNPSIGFILSKTFGYENQYTVYKESGVIVGVFPKLKIGLKSVSVPHFSYGDPIFNEQNNFNFLPKKFEIRSYYKLSKYYSDEKVVVQLNLPKNIEILENSFKSKLRSQIKKGFSYNAIIRKGGLELLNGFYEVYSKNMYDLGSPPLPLIFFHNILVDYKYGNVKITLLEFNNQPVASGFTISFMGFEEVCWASSDHKFNRYNFNMVLYWEMIKDSILNGNNIFSFGRSSKESSTLKFKLQWGSPEVRQIFINYSEPIRINIKNIHLLSKIWRLLPYNITLLFSKFLSKKIY